MTNSRAVFVRTADNRFPVLICRACAPYGAYQHAIQIWPLGGQKCTQRVHCFIHRLISPMHQTCIRVFKSDASVNKTTHPNYCELIAHPKNIDTRYIRLRYAIAEGMSLMRCELAFLSENCIVSLDRKEVEYGIRRSTKSLVCATRIPAKVYTALTTHIHTRWLWQLVDTTWPWTFTCKLRH